MNGVLLVCECSLNRYYIRWWGHLNSACCNWICFNFYTHRQWGCQNITLAFAHVLSPSDARLCPRATLWNFHNICFDFGLTSKPIAHKRLKIVSSAENHGKARRVADRWAHFENTHVHICFCFPWVVLNVTVDWDPCWFLRPDSKLGEENRKNPTYVSK